MRGQAETLISQFVASASIALGSAGLSRDGTAFWLGVGLITAGSFLLLRAIGLSDLQRQRDHRELIEKIETSGIEAVQLSEPPPGGLRKWLRWLAR
jgi:hypothetical protein